VSDTIAAAPFARWLKLRAERMSQEELAMLVGWPGEPGVRRLYRYAHTLKAGSVDGRKGDYLTDRYDRLTVVEALSCAGVGLWELADLVDEHGAPVPGREEYDDDVELEPDAFCGHCHETVTPIDGNCPWCERPTSDAYGAEKRYCKAEDRMVFAAHDGTCWRCGGKTDRGVPYQPCKCGCGQMVHRFDRHGRLIEWVRGHAPRMCENASLLAAAPFADYLRDEVANVDALTAVALKHGLAREQLAAILRGDIDQLDRETVRRGLWMAGRYGQAKGMPMRPGPLFFDLYPGDARSRTCPGCGKGKAPHALLCKPCRVRRNRREGIGTPRAVTRIRDELFEEAYRLHVEDGLTVADVADRIFERTPHTNIGSTTQALRREWRRRGWPFGQERRSEAVAA
jgi:hypothetical protein